MEKGEGALCVCTGRECISFENGTASIFCSARSAADEPEFASSAGVSAFASLIAPLAGAELRGRGESAVAMEGKEGEGMAHVSADESGNGDDTQHEISQDPAPQRLPQKRYFRQRAHANPFSDHELV